MSLPNKKYKASIIGASGYTGSEIARILVNHPFVSIEHITSETHAGKAFSDLHPQFVGILDLPLERAAEIDVEEQDVLFLALPHGVSMEFVRQWYGKTKLVDLSGDFRLSNATVYEDWYKKRHVYAEGFGKAVYGMPELHGEAIAQADLVANPGCYPTASILGLAPALAGELVHADSVIIDAKSGTTGAGVKASDTTHFSNVNENFRAYGIGNHRHTIEIEEQLGLIQGNRCQVQFTPHLLPVDRGILATAYASLAKDVSEEQVVAAYKTFYREQPFIRFRKQAPSLKDVRGSNYCDIFIHIDPRTKRLIVVSAIDNLVKGAAGQAVHNMNLMLGLEQAVGLDQVPMKP
ncbi:MAG: N-acetyl-gamma-glutamyl-phosphate reductase [Lunatimonas sp.]|uniref:N-acetyl-gamma-glutamyl-phosphate reductase n=1 Tax=Lunatimonas sp. TaxID=2060141 RepID=UPI00263AF867|nr:N-acetyl-gamma-glutamyl-phosphate reductase [Lunatimonas sp.]MCC5938171.1 N-acetyl-gamma-glutamyl-phosphate reductase [Lunatimonas sp.]